MEEPRIIRRPARLNEQETFETPAPKTSIPLWAKILTLFGMIVFFMGVMINTSTTAMNFNDYDTQRTVMIMGSLISQTGLLMISLAMVYLGIFMVEMDHKTRRICLSILALMMMVSFFTMI